MRNKLNSQNKWKNVGRIENVGGFEANNNISKHKWTNIHIH